MIKIMQVLLSLSLFCVISVHASSIKHFDPSDGAKSSQSAIPTEPEYIIAQATPANVASTPVKKGLTFGVRKTWKRGELHKSAITTVGCKDSKANECNPYTGDMNCSVDLPVLCFAPLPNQASPDPTLHQWAAGRIKVTNSVPGNSFKKLDDVNQACSRFGNNWRAATFHESPKGWNWTAFGTTDDAEKYFARFWVHIKDQPANCWAN